MAWALMLLATVGAASSASSSRVEVVEHPPRLALRPETSAAEPLTKRTLQFILSPDVADANRTRYFLIETVPGSATGNSSQYVQLSLWACADPATTTTELVTPLIDTISSGPFPAMDAVGSVQIRASAWTAKKSGQLLGTSAPQTVFFDLRYTTLTHQIQVDTLDHNRVRLTAVPDDPALGQQTKSFTWDHFIAPRGAWQPTSSEWMYKQSHNASYTFEFGGPGVYFVGLVYASNGFDLHATRAAPSLYDGLFAQPAPMVAAGSGKADAFEPIAFVVPYNNGSFPKLPSVQRVVKLRPVAGNLELCIPHRELTIMGGPDVGLIFLPLCKSLLMMNAEHMASTKHLALVLPAGVSVLPAAGRSGATAQNVTSLGSGLWVVSSSSSGGALSRDVALALKAEPSLIGTTTPMQLAIYADSSSPPTPGSAAWQTVSLRVVAWPNVATPKHLVTAITDGPTSRFQDLVILAEGSTDVQVLSAYRRLGLSVYPRDGANSIDPAASLGRYFFPENRTGQEWKGLRYGLEHSTFSHGFNGDGLFCLASSKSAHGGIGCPVNESQLPQGLSPSQRALELTKWANAVAFFNQTSQLDIAYDGFMLNNSFENLRLITR